MRSGGELSASLCLDQTIYASNYDGPDKWDTFTTLLDRSNLKWNKASTFRIFVSIGESQEAQPPDRGLVWLDTGLTGDKVELSGVNSQRETTTNSISKVPDKSPTRPSRRH
jgi:hypothetical protein